MLVVILIFAVNGVLILILLLVLLIVVFFIFAVNGVLLMLPYLWLEGVLAHKWYQHKMRLRK